MTIERIDDYRQPRDEKAPPRAPPANPDAEQQLLGALMLNNEVFAHIAFLEAAHFSEEIHRRIYTIATTLIGQQKTATPISIKGFLGQQEIAAGLTPQGYLARLAAEACAPAVARDYALTIRDLFVRREIIRAAEDAMAQAFDAPVDMRPGEIASAVLERLSELTEDPTNQTRAAAADSAYRLIARAQEIREGKGPGDGIPSGIPALDRLIGPMSPGELIVIAGRPGMGKTTLATNLVMRIADQKDGNGARTNGAILFELEMGEDQTSARMMADRAYLRDNPIHFQDILRATALDDERMWRITNAQRELARMPLEVDYASRLTLVDVRARIHTMRKRMAAKGVTLRVAVVDYLKFIQATDRYKGNRAYEVGEITAGLKQIAKDEGIAMVLLAQLNRGVEAREDKRPTLADLRESGDIENDADVVAFFYREAYYAERKMKENDEDSLIHFDVVKNQSEIIVSKNRAGATGIVKLFCDIGCSHIGSGEHE
jgi:replicative DNA helicase